MSSVAVEPRYTPEQYLKLERAAPHKSELIGGRMYALAGASREHSLIVFNLAGELRPQLRGRPCEAYATDMRVKCQVTTGYLYPALVIVCGEPQFEGHELDTLLNPTVIIEVLSPPTEAGDRGYKFAHYRRIPSVQEYIMIAQDRVHVERAERRGNGWFLTEMERLEDVLMLTSVGCTIPLSAIYEKVPLSEEYAPGQRSGTVEDRGHREGEYE